jgi:hypothetical protein
MVFEDLNDMRALFLHEKKNARLNRHMHMSVRVCACARARNFSTAISIYSNESILLASQVLYIRMCTFFISFFQFFAH